MVLRIGLYSDVRGRRPRTLVGVTATIAVLSYQVQNREWLAGSRSVSRMGKVVQVARVGLL